MSPTLKRQIALPVARMMGNIGLERKVVVTSTSGTWNQPSRSGVEEDWPSDEVGVSSLKYLAILGGFLAEDDLALESKPLLAAWTVVVEGRLASRENLGRVLWRFGTMNCLVMVPVWWFGVN